MSHHYLCGIHWLAQRKHIMKKVIITDTHEPIPNTPLHTVLCVTIPLKK